MYPNIFLVDQSLDFNVRFCIFRNLFSFRTILDKKWSNLLCVLWKCRSWWPNTWFLRSWLWAWLFVEFYKKLYFCHRNILKCTCTNSYLLVLHCYKHPLTTIFLRYHFCLACFKSRFNHPLFPCHINGQHCIKLGL